MVNCCVCEKPQTEAKTNVPNIFLKFIEMENLVCKFNFFKPQKTQKLYVLKVFQKKKKVKVEISNFFTFELLVFEIFFCFF